VTLRLNSILKDKNLAPYGIIAFMDYGVRGARKLLNRFRIKGSCIPNYIKPHKKLSF